MIKNVVVIIIFGSIISANPSVNVKQVVEAFRKTVHCLKVHGKWGIESCWIFRC